MEVAGNQPMRRLSFRRVRSCVGDDGRRSTAWSNVSVLPNRTTRPTLTSAIDTAMAYYLSDVGNLFGAAGLDSNELATRYPNGLENHLKNTKDIGITSD